MIYNYPYFGFPNYLNYMSKTPYRNVAYPNRANLNARNLPNTSNNYYRNDFEYKRPNQQEKPHSYKSNSKHKSEPEKSKKDDDNSSSPFLNLFGIQLYFDDILLICMILFLYNEKIDDNYLLLSLVLLLLG